MLRMGLARRVLKLKSSVAPIPAPVNITLRVDPRCVVSETEVWGVKPGASQAGGFPFPDVVPGWGFLA